jgi:hypothetical protein
VLRLPQPLQINSFHYTLYISPDSDKSWVTADCRLQQTAEMNAAVAASTDRRVSANVAWLRLPLRKQWYRLRRPILFVAVGGFVVSRSIMLSSYNTDTLLSATVYFDQFSVVLDALSGSNFTNTTQDQPNSVYKSNYGSGASTNTTRAVLAAPLPEESRLEGDSDSDSDSDMKATGSNISLIGDKKGESGEITIEGLDMHNRTEALSSCVNSARWLQGPRYGNLREDPFITNDLAKHMILNISDAFLEDNAMASLLGQSVCHANSRLLNITKLHLVEALDDERLVRLWAVRLLYLLIHYHQHRLAIPEAMERYQYGSDSKCMTAAQLAKDHDVGVFDYECPDANYLIMPLGGNGLGANVRGGMVPALVMGLITDRIVVFVNNAQKGERRAQMPWPLASCPRRDYQCFFWPSTPCSLTQDEIGDAYELSDAEFRPLMYRNKLPGGIDHHKVWKFNTPFTPLAGFHQLAAETLYERALKLISSLVDESKYPHYFALLRKAAEAIRMEDTPRPGYNYAAANLKIQHAAALYSMRPNPRNARELHRILTEIVPADFEPDTSVGLPIRGKLHAIRLAMHDRTREFPSSNPFCFHLAHCTFP